jgi:hypothetical protein
MTVRYTRDLQDITIPTARFYRDIPADEPVYLCVPTWLNWIPIAWSKVDAQTKSITFRKLEGNVGFRLATYADGELQVLTEPFYLNRYDYTMYFLEPSDTLREVALWYKFNSSIETYARRMRGGVVEGSHTPDFRRRDTLYTLNGSPKRLYYVAKLPQPSQPYRYIRYFGPKNGYCDVSDIAYYAPANDSIPLAGRPFGTANGALGDGEHEYPNVYDGDPYTSFHYHALDGGWAALDLGVPTNIAKIVFTPRNVRNFIERGDTYELFYERRGQWHSAGRQVATSDSLLYTVPQGALLYLKNHSRGKDERLFEYKYDERRQYFW